MKAERDNDFNLHITDFTSAFPIPEKLYLHIDNIKTTVQYKIEKIIQEGEEEK